MPVESGGGCHIALSRADKKIIGQEEGRSIELRKGVMEDDATVRP